MDIDKEELENLNECIARRDTDVVELYKDMLKNIGRLSSEDISGHFDRLLNELGSGWKNISFVTVNYDVNNIEAEIEGILGSVRRLKSAINKYEAAADAARRISLGDRLDKIYNGGRFA